MKIKWFRKSRNKKPDADTTANDKENARIQGSYTDYQETPYMMRFILDPMGEDEIQAFNWVIDRLDREHPECNGKQSELIDYGTDENWLYVDKQGMLRVSKVAPVRGRR